MHGNTDDPDVDIIGLNEDHEENEDIISCDTEKQMTETDKKQTVFKTLKEKPEGCQDVQGKPPFSYIALIAMAIRDSPRNMATLAEINSYLSERFEFFRGPYTGWRNSIRHNLSLNECFIKVLRDPKRPWAKDNYWILNPNSEYTFADGVFSRRRKKIQSKDSKEKRPDNLSRNNLKDRDGPEEGKVLEQQSNQLSQRSKDFSIKSLLTKSNHSSSDLKRIRSGQVISSMASAQWSDNQPFASPGMAGHFWNNLLLHQLVPQSFNQRLSYSQQGYMMQHRPLPNHFHPYL